MNIEEIKNTLKEISGWNRPKIEEHPAEFEKAVSYI